MSFLNTTLNGLFAGTSAPEAGVVGHAQRIVKSWSGVNPYVDGIAVISHELRNSLGVVRNAAGLLRVQVDPEGIERARLLIERHVAQMSRHIELLLDPALLNRRKDALSLSSVDLRTIVKNSIDAIAPDCARRGHRLDVTLPADALWVYADATRLEQVFLNLLINAAKYTPDGGEIALTMDRFEGQASVRIRDSGVGIAPSQLSRIFEIFVQVDATTKLAEGGRGIGLAVVRDLVEMHCGTVRATSAGLGLGSEFAVLLPASSAQ